MGILAIGVYLIAKGSAPEVITITPTPSSAPTITASPTSSPSSVPVKPTGWQIFKAEKYGFSMEIPPSYSQTKFQDSGFQYSPELLLSAEYKNNDNNRIIILIEKWRDIDISLLKGGYRKVIQNPEDYRSGKISNMVVNAGFISINEIKKDNYLFFIVTYPTNKQLFLKNLDILPDYDKNLLVNVKYIYPEINETNTLKSVDSIKFSK